MNPDSVPSEAERPGRKDLRRGDGRPRAVVNLVLLVGDSVGRRVVGGLNLEVLGGRVRDSGVPLTNPVLGATPAAYAATVTVVVIRREAWTTLKVNGTAWVCTTSVAVSITRRYEPVSAWPTT
jgi:hypothetical protein